MAPRATSSPFLALIDHPWLDRLVRGRAWIAIVAVALLGIVAMQVALLRLGTQIANDTSTVNALTQQNETAQAAIGTLEASGSVSSDAASRGMLYPAPSAVTYLGASAGDARSATHRMVAPSPAAVAAAAARPPASPGLATTAPAVTPLATPAAATTAAGTATAVGTAPAGTTATTTPSATNVGAVPSGTTTTTAPATTTPATTTPATTTPATTTPATPAATAPTAGAAPTSVAGGATQGP